MDKSTYSKNRRNNLKFYINELKRNNVCGRCGCSDYRVLEFHHRVPKEKKFSIFHAIHNRYSLPSVQREISKCEIVCANCHRIIHYEWEKQEDESDV